VQRDELSVAEQAVWDAFPTAGTVELAGDAEPVRAEVVAALLLGAREAEPGRVPAVRLSGARLTGVLDLSYAEAPYALLLNDCVLELFATGLVARGTFRLQDARIGRRCTLTRADLSDPGGVAFNGEKLHVDGSLTLDKGFTAEGEVLLLSAAVQGTVQLIDATVRNPGGRSVNAGLSTIDGGFRGYPGFTAEGEVSLGAAQIRGSVNLKGARLAAPGGSALWAARLQVNGGLFCAAGFSAEGEISLMDARVGAGVDFSGARLSNPGGRTLTAWGLSVDGVVDCCEGFSADGTVSFTSAKLGSALCLDDAKLDGRLYLRGLRAASLKTRPSTAFNDRVDLRHARIGWLDDDAARWPPDLRMDGLVYDSLNNPLPVEDRLTWLAAGPEGYQPQPYEQLATVYRGQGHDQAARAVLLAKQRRRRATQPLPLKLWEYLQDWTVGYGYQPSRAVLWLAALLLIGTAAFTTEHPPAAKPGESPPFNALLYSLDLLLPIIGFGQEGAFHPHGAHQWLAAAMIATGWLLATTIATGVTRVLSRQ
jgi:hypothetical protein